MAIKIFDSLKGVSQVLKPKSPDREQFSNVNLSRKSTLRSDDSLTEQATRATLSANTKSSDPTKISDLTSSNNQVYNPKIKYLEDLARKLDALESTYTQIEENQLKLESGGNSLSARQRTALESETTELQTAATTFEEEITTSTEGTSESYVKVGQCDGGYAAGVSQNLQALRGSQAAVRVALKGARRYS